MLTLAIVNCGEIKHVLFLIHWIFFSFILNCNIFFVVHFLQNVLITVFFSSSELIFQILKQKILLIIICFSCSICPIFLIIYNCKLHFIQQFIRKFTYIKNDLFKMGTRRGRGRGVQVSFQLIKMNK